MQDSASSPDVQVMFLGFKKLRFCGGAYADRCFYPHLYFIDNDRYE